MQPLTGARRCAANGTKSGKNVGGIKRAGKLLLEIHVRRPKGEKARVSQITSTSVLRTF